MLRSALFALPCLVLFAAADANAQGYDTHLFRPALDSRGIVSVNGVDVLRGGSTSVGLVIDYGRNILRAPDRTLVENSFTGTFQFNYGIANRAVVGVSAPVLLMSGIDVQSLQHVALHGKLKLTRPSSDIGIALAAQVGVPITNTPAAADPTFWYWPMLVLEKRFGDEEQLKIALNAGYRGHSASGATLDLIDGRFRDGSRITYGAGASYRVADPLDLLVETYGTYLLGDSSAAVRPSNEALLGIKLFVEKSSYLVVGGGPRYTNGFEAADLRATIGFIFEPPVGDADGDGITDGEDDCPNVPGVRSRRPGANGCQADDDEDGIPNVEDACPYVKGVRTNDPHTNGCPPDDDGDGIPNAVDACPKLPGVATKDPRTNGCPPIPDRDNDGVPDAEDACPDIRGKRHPDPARNGCPDVFIGPNILVVFEKILFETGSAKILPQSSPILDEVAKALSEHPELTLIEVAGHADERGGERMNLVLTQARVESVVHALIERKVDRSRLRAKGYGYYCPRDEGHDENAWSKNRRVEFLIVKTTSGPTGVPLGCDNAAAHGVTPAPVP